MEKKSKIVNVQFGLISIGNNLPLLTEQIRKAIKYNKKQDDKYNKEVSPYPKDL